VRSRVKSIVTSSYFQNFILALIIINGVTLGFETSKEIVKEYGHFLEIFDTLVITIFVIEIVLRIFAHGKEFFKDGWSIFDLIIVLISLFPANSGFEIFRILRVLRLFRLITVVPQMKKIVMALLSTIPGMATIAGLMTLFFYMFAIISTQLYGKAFPELFGDLGESFYTLFQVMTLESWSMGVVRPLMEKFPYAWVFFVPFIFVVTFIMINLIVAVIVDAMNEINRENTTELEEEIKDKEEEILDEINALKAEIRELKELLKKSPPEG
jgi:voltage-gated sodium channel